MYRDRIMGCFLGLAIGDAFGAPYEGGILERLLWAIIGKRDGKRRWTDDTQMTIDLSKSLIACNGLDQNDLALRLANSYHWSRGYGPGTSKVLKRIRDGEPWHSANRAVFNSGSFGNGATVRSTAIGLFFFKKAEDYVARVATQAATVTHAHPLGIKGAVLTALATALSLNGMHSGQIICRLLRYIDSAPYVKKLRTAQLWLKEKGRVGPREVARTLGNSVEALESCVTSLYAAFAFREKSSDELLDFIIAVGGDVDTIAALACGLWGAINGTKGLPKTKVEGIAQWQKLVECAELLSHAAGNHCPDTGLRSEGGVDRSAS